MPDKRGCMVEKLDKTNLLAGAGTVQKHLCHIARQPFHTMPGDWFMVGTGGAFALHRTVPGMAWRNYAEPRRKERMA